MYSFMGGCCVLCAKTDCNDAIDGDDFSRHFDGSHGRKCARRDGRCSRAWAAPFLKFFWIVFQLVVCGF